MPYKQWMLGLGALLASAVPLSLVSYGSGIQSNPRGEEFPAVRGPLHAHKVVSEIRDPRVFKAELGKWGLGPEDQDILRRLYERSSQEANSSGVWVAIWPGQDGSEETWVDFTRRGRDRKATGCRVKWRRHPLLDAVGEGEEGATLSFSGYQWKDTWEPWDLAHSEAKRDTLLSACRGAAWEDLVLPGALEAKLEEWKLEKETQEVLLNLYEKAFDPEEGYAVWASLRGGEGEGEEATADFIGTDLYGGKAGCRVQWRTKDADGKPVDPVLSFTAYYKEEENSSGWKSVEAKEIEEIDNLLLSACHRKK